MRKLTRKRFLAFLLPALLLFAQQSAMAHLASHAAEQSPNPEKSLVHLKLCGKCLSAEKFTHVPATVEHRFDAGIANYSHTPAQPTVLHSTVTVWRGCRDPPQ